MFVYTNEARQYFSPELPQYTLYMYQKTSSFGRTADAIRIPIRCHRFPGTSGAVEFLRMRSSVLQKLIFDSAADRPYCRTDCFFIGKNLEYINFRNLVFKQFGIERRFTRLTNHYTVLYGTIRVKQTNDNWLKIFTDFKITNTHYKRYNLTEYV